MQGILRRARGVRLLRFDPVGHLLKADAHYRAKRCLDEMEDWQLLDIGLTRADISDALNQR
jgi:uncharacterized protein YjiS (DUF1127 family)